MTFPFHSCPIEILQTIFEYSALSEEKILKASITISHVCRSWRRITLVTPRLWATITLKLDRPHTMIDLIWNEMTKRASSVPLVVEIEVSQISLRDSLPRDFEHVRSIKSLSLIFGGFQTSEDHLLCFQELHELTFPIPRCPIQHLEVNNTFVFRYTSSWALDSWIRKWSSVQTIKIDAGVRVHFEDKQPFYNIRSLDLDADGTYSIHDVATLFPNLDTLTLSGEQDRGSYPIILFPYLKSLFLRRIRNDLAWDIISCPKLVTFYPPENRSPPSLYGFLQAHPSIKCLKLWWLDQALLSHISESAPQVNSLQLDGVLALSKVVDWVGLNAPPIFPNLEELVIYDKAIHDTIKSFDFLVVARCLPIQHPECRRIQGISKQLKTLVIRILDGRPPSSWISSHLLTSVKEMNVNRITEAPKATRYELKWEEDEGMDSIV